MKKTLVSSFSPNVIGEGIELVYESIIQYCRFTISTAGVESIGEGAKRMYYYIPVHRNTTLLSSHRGCSKDKISPLWFGAQHKTILIVIQTILMQFL